MDESRRSMAGKMDSRQLSMATNDESVSMYLSFDADDTLSGGSKWQSALVTQNSQYLEVHSSKMEGNFDDKDLRRTVLKDLQQLAISEPDQSSPLRPFDKSVLNLHNALCSTPSKDNTQAEPLAQIIAMNLSSVDDKENTQPDGDNHAGGENSTLSSSVDLTANTVKANTLKTADVTVDEESLQEPVKTPAPSQVYPLSANVVLENITEGVSMLASPPAEKEIVQVNEVVNEVSELIAKALKISQDSVKPSASVKPSSSNLKVEVGKKRPSLLGALPRPRRSYQPITSTETRNYSIMQRMSVVVKTTLNSPARKMGTGGGVAASRRSFLPVSKSVKNTNRKSLAVASFRTPTKTIQKPAVLPAKEISENVFKCKICGQTFRLKCLLTTHVRMHDLVENGPKTLKRLHVNPAGAGSSKNRCKFCDKNFALERALHIHLMQNCTKIPPTEKRKLQFTELNHEKKAQLPKIGVVPSSAVAARLTLPQKSGIQAISTPGTASTNVAQSMVPPSVKKVLKNVAHAGVFRTPTKTVPCHICKQSFKSILEFTNHSLTVHVKKQLNEDEMGAQSVKD
ncbi:uncharacterized protein LOC108098877 isoform X2 [Drosophila ficusphila]|uniref:uncharacterized protein LOC108098877 isoform X2 n=1 Tax=Drosophila ficusphila TaxID=30025 RepID=UPI001C8A3EA8|nr:uncharacterized protein LOC108098877 isoform X2 [Drosophila ficusphila]